MSTECGEQSQGPSTSHSSLHKVTASHLGRNWSRSCTQASSISGYAAVTWMFSCAFFVGLTLRGNLARLERTGRKRKNQSGSAGRCSLTLAGTQSENSGVRKPEGRSCPVPPRGLVLSGLNEGKTYHLRAWESSGCRPEGLPLYSDASKTAWVYCGS